MNEGGSGQLLSLSKWHSSQQLLCPAAAKPRLLLSCGEDTELAGRELLCQSSVPREAHASLASAMPASKCHRCCDQLRSLQHQCSQLSSDPSFATQRWHLTHSPSGSSSPVSLPPHTSLRFLNENQQSSRHPAPSTPVSRCRGAWCPGLAVSSDK